MTFTYGASRAGSHSDVASPSPGASTHVGPAGGGGDASRFLAPLRGLPFVLTGGSRCSAATVQSCALPSPAVCGRRHTSQSQMKP